MHRRPTALAASAPALPAALMGAVLIASSAALFLALMAPRITAELMFGPVCSGHGWLQPHCTACYVAAALAGSGLGLVALAASRGRKRP